MALIFSAPLTSTVTSFDAAQANGSSVDPRGLMAPVPGYIEIRVAPDGSPALMSQIDASEAEAGGGVRSEIDYVPEANAERWYVWDVYFETIAAADLITFMQVHDSPDGGESPVKYPNFEFQIQSGYVFASVPLNCPSEATSSSRLPPQRRVPVPFGRWVTCAVHANWATDSNGFLEAFFDGRLLARDMNRACGYADATGPYWKLGLYEFAHAGVTGTSRAWYRNAKLYSTGHTAVEILGRDAGALVNLARLGGA